MASSIGGRTTPKNAVASTGGSIVSFSDDPNRRSRTSLTNNENDQAGSNNDDDANNNNNNNNVVPGLHLQEDAPQQLGPSMLMRAVLDRKRDEIIRANPSMRPLHQGGQYPRAGGGGGGGQYGKFGRGANASDKVTGSRDFERFRRARRKLAASQKWTATSDRACECAGVGLRFMYGFSRQPHSFEAVAQHDAGGGLGGARARVGSTQPVGYSGGANGARQAMAIGAKPPVRARGGGEKAMMDGSIAHIFTFYSKLQSPEHQLGRKPKSYEEIREANSTMSYLELLCFCRDFDVVPNLLPKEDLAVLWKIHRSQMLNALDQIDTHLSDVQKSSMDLTQFMQMLVKIALMAFADDLPHVAPWLHGGGGPHAHGTLDHLRNSHFTGRGQKPAGAHEAGEALVGLLANYLHLHDHRAVQEVVKTRGAATCSLMNNHCLGEHNGVKNKQMLLNEAAVRARSFVERRTQQQTLAREKRLAAEAAAEERRRLRMTGGLQRPNSTGGSGGGGGSANGGGMGMGMGMGGGDGGGSVRSRAKSTGDAPPADGTAVSPGGGGEGGGKTVDFSATGGSERAGDGNSKTNESTASPSSRAKGKKGGKPKKVWTLNLTRPVGAIEHFERNVLNRSNSNETMDTVAGGGGGGSGEEDGNVAKPPLLKTMQFTSAGRSPPLIPKPFESVKFDPALESTERWKRRYERLSDKDVAFQPKGQGGRHAMIMPLSPDRGHAQPHDEDGPPPPQHPHWNTSTHAASSPRRGKHTPGAGVGAKKAGVGANGAHHRRAEKEKPKPPRPNEVGLAAHHLSTAQKDALALYDTKLGGFLKPFVFAERRDWVRLKVPALDLGAMRRGGNRVYTVQIQVKNTFPEMISLEAAARGALHDMVSFVYSASTTIIPGMTGTLLAEFDPSAAYSITDQGEVFGFVEITARHVTQGPAREDQKAARKAAAAAAREGKARAARAEALRQRSLRGEVLSDDEYAEIRASVEERGLTRSPDNGSHHTGGGRSHGSPPLEILATHHIPVYLQIESEDRW